MACEAHKVGAVFIQPQRFGRTSFDDSPDVLVRDLLNLLPLLAADAAQGGRVAAAMGEALAAVVLRFIEQSKAGIDNARERLRKLLSAFIDSTAKLGQTLADVDEPQELLAAGQQLLAKLTGVVEALTADALRQHVTEVLAVLEQDLGLTSDFIEQQIWAVADEVIARLQQIPADADAAERETRLEIVSLVRRIKRQLRGLTIFPQLNADHIAGLLLNLLRASGLDILLRKAACTGAGLHEAFDASSKLIEVIPFHSGFVAGGTLGAAQPRTIEAQYCWYASWLLGAKATEPLKEKRVEHKWGAAGFLDPLHPFVWLFDKLKIVPKERRLEDDDIWIDKDKKKVMKGDDVLFEGTDVDWTSLPVFDKYDGRYTFQHVSPQGMEKWARVTAWLRDYLVAALHLTPEVSIKKGDVWANLLNSLEVAAHGTFKLSTKSPFLWWLEHGAEISSSFLRQLIDKSILIAPTLFGSLEGRHSKASRKNFIDFQLTHTFINAYKTYQYRALLDQLRDGVLSFLTLLNYAGPTLFEPPLDGPFPFYKAPDDRPQNRAEIDGIAGPIVGLSILLLVQHTPREFYGHPFAQSDDPDVHRLRDMWLKWLLGAGLGVGLLGGLVGAVTAELLGWVEDFSVIGRKMLQSVITTWVFFWPTLYVGMEGNTDDGKYNPNGDAFKGYPDHETSPYRLPFPKDEARLCVQGNQGMWSHNHLKVSQVYAYDFALDQDEPVVAARAGTVISFSESTDNDDPSSPNFVQIRHDAVDSDHDLDVRGTVITTSAKYLHGRKNSVTAALGPSPIGTTVARGQKIMSAGDTGFSFHNHVHIEVLNGAGETIPFVFKEVTNLFSTDGVPQAGIFYTSDNG